MGRPATTEERNYIACIDLNFDWSQEEVTLFDNLWAEGLDISRIAKRLKRPVNEVGILAIDRRMNGHIETRKGGVHGGEAH